MSGLDHINLAVPERHLETLVDFYERVIGLRRGERPPFPFPGAWLYADGVARAVLHIACYDDDDTDLELPASRFHHFCLTMSGLEACRMRLQSQNVAFKEQNRPGVPVVQLFVIDPAGVRIELSFDKQAEGLAEPAA